MTSIQSSNRLQSQLVYMIALETDIEENLEKLMPKVSGHNEAIALLTGFHTLSNKHRQALETRLHTIADKETPMKNPSTDFHANRLSEKDNFPVSTALQIIYTFFNQAVIGYSVLHPLATRFLDSPYIADEGTSYHLTRQHTQNYVQAIQQISRLLHDVVLWELDQEGLECQCMCPSCGIGICLCALAGRSFLSQVWVEESPIAVDKEIFVHPPKLDSAATKAGLGKGDVILAVNGEELEWFGDIQEVVKKTEPGKEIRLMVRRSSDEKEEVVLYIHE
ncbi:MAG: hypothetical protein HeimC3_30440 [Candidatus Heimdallarchaeota archaeon LC_3]|nr:MAG: hypothetical protein HeimC3_46790 [Candidatus Heimdallarchaeota archaeon LC_3]OLS22503.1 MAG: hypothetical protein HeimC3_30440 [Candidatus Heimdallarchaeota archaeon LC_3]